MTNRTVLVRLRADVSDLVAKSKLATAAIGDLNREIDKSNDRTAWLAQGILALTPAVTSLGAGAVPVLSGMATQMMLTVAAAGTMALAFNGVGDALGALNDYQLDPTAENLQQLNDAMAKIGPAGQAFVEFLDSMGPALSELSNTAREGLFPGLTSGLQDLMTLAPELNSVIGEISEGLGQLGAEAGAGLSGPRFAEFFEYLETRAKPILIEMGRTLGNFTDGFLNMIVAFDPLTADFSSGLLDMSRSFVAWSDGLSSSTGFQEFVDYVREAGPQALEFLGAFINFFVELAKAAAPVGAVMLPLLTGLVNVLGDLASTPLGPITVGFLAFTSALGRAQALMAITGSGVVPKLTAGLRKQGDAFTAAGATARAGADTMLSTWATAGARTERETKRIADGAKVAGGGLKEMGRAAVPVAGQVGLLAVAMSDYDDKAGLANTTTLTLAGSLGGKWGAAAGAALGLFLDMKEGAEEATKGFEGLDAAIDSGKIEELTARIAEAKAEMADQDDVTGFGDFFSDALRDVGASGSEGAMKVYADAIADAEAELANLKNAQQDVADDETLYNSLMAETRALETNIAAMREKRAEALRGLNAELDYKASILDARDALKENGKSVNENTRAGQANLQALYGMASAFNAQADSAKNSAREVRAGRKQFIDAAVAMGMGEDAARRLARQLYELPANVPIKIGVDHETAMAHARAVKAELASIDRSIDIYINVRKPNMSGYGPQITSADGDTVPGPRYPYGDKIHAFLAPGEEIISNRFGQADKNREALKAANRGARIAVVGYADGGTAGDDDEDDKKKRRRRRFFDSVDNTKALEEAIVRLTAKTEDQTKAAERDAASRDEWAALMADVAKGTVSGFNTGLFDRDSNPWAAGATGGPIGNLTKDIAGLTERSSLQTQLAAAGLTGDALAAALSQGTNADLTALLSSGQAGQYAALFAQRSALQGSVGQAAGQQAYGAQYSAAAEQARLSTAALVRSEVKLERMGKVLEDTRAVLEAINADHPERTGAAAGAAVRGEAVKGQRDKKNGGGRGWKTTG